MDAKPQQSFWQMWNMCFGYLGIQFGFALQNANVGRIFQTLGASIEDLPILFVAGPLTGLLVQPIVGYLSDRTWTRLGRRRPYLLAGAVCASLALLVMPNSPTLWVAAGMLWMLDASFNFSMEPFRALVADQLPPSQRPAGYGMQVFFIGIASVVASLLPWILTKAGVANVAAAGQIPQTVKYSFYCGAVVLLATMLWTMLRTREYPPAALQRLSDAGVMHHVPINRARIRRDGMLWLAAGGVGLAVVTAQGLGKELYLLTGCVMAYGVGQLIFSFWRARNMLTNIMADVHDMPYAMRRLAVVQFFSWFALFALWIYMIPAVTQAHFGTADPQSARYNEGANWVGVLYAVDNIAAAIGAALIPLMARRLGLRASHLTNLWLGGFSLISFLFIADPRWLVLPMVGIGLACASILLLPYALLSEQVPAQKMGVYMGIFNFFIVIPQLLAATFLSLLLKTFFGGAPIFGLFLGGISLLVAGLAVLRVNNRTSRIAAAQMQATDDAVIETAEAAAEAAGPGL